MSKRARFPPVGTIGRYEVLGRLAVGGMAEVFLARETGPRGAGRELVVKRILPHIASDERHAESFAQEARLCLRLRHPSICPIYEFGEDQDSFFLAMEWVHGVSLRAMVEAGQAHGGLPFAVVAKIVADIAGALHHAHTAKGDDGQPLGIVHRDVTPENIMVGFDGVAKLIDFGVAKAEGQTLKTQQGELKGKFAYMSPEQYRGEGLDGGSDVFALGVCLWEALAGRSLYERGDEYQTVAAILFDEELPSLRALRPDVPQTFETIANNALERSRDERTATADELEGQLLHALAEERQVVRDADVAKLLSQLFPGARESDPELDRTPLTRRRSSMDPLVLAALGAELDEVEVEIAHRQRRKKLTIGLIALALITSASTAALWTLSDTPPSEVEVSSP